MSVAEATLILRLLAEEGINHLKDDEAEYSSIYRATDKSVLFSKALNLSASTIEEHGEQRERKAHNEVHRILNHIERGNVRFTINRYCLIEDRVFHYKFLQ